MFEERNVYWDYKNDRSSWRSKKFMDFEDELKPKKISPVAYSKQGYAVKWPLWLFTKVEGVDYGDSIRSMGAAIASVIMVGYETIEVYFNEASKSIIFVVDCSYLAKSLGVKGKYGERERLRDLQRLIVDLLRTIKMKDGKYLIDIEGNDPYSYSEMVDIDGFERMDYLFIKDNYIYDQEEFLTVLHTETDKKINEVKKKIEKMMYCNIFKYIVNDVSEYKKNRLAIYLADIFYRISGEMLLPFLLAHLNRGELRSRDGLLVLPWRCHHICREPCGLHHPMDLLFSPAIASFTLEAMAARRKARTNSSQLSPFVDHSLFVEIYNLNLSELALFLFFSSFILDGYLVNVNGLKQVASFSFAFYTRDVKRTVGRVEEFKTRYGTLCNEKKTKHALAQELKNSNSISWMCPYEEESSFLDELLKRSRTSGKDLYQIKKSLSPMYGENKCGVLNNIFFCSEMILTKFFNSQVYKTGILNLITFIDINRIHACIDVEKVLDLLDELKSCFTKNKLRLMGLEGPFSLNIEPPLIAGKRALALYNKNYISIYIILKMLIGDCGDDECQNLDQQARILANNLANKLSLETQDVFDNNKKYLVMNSIKKFISNYKYEFIHERELKRNFSTGKNKKYVDEAIELLCNKKFLVKFSKTFSNRPGRKSSNLYRIEKIALAVHDAIK